MKLVNKNSSDLEHIDKNLSHRKKDLGSQLFNQDLAKADSSVLFAPDDEGVWRNGGRRGANYGPQTLLSLLHKFQGHAFGPQALYFEDVGTFSSSHSFQEKQELQEQRIEDLLKRKLPYPLVHLGGGHDHIYPLAKALYDSNPKPLVILNIDAHLDTRQDSVPHSGTPFRQLDAEVPLHLYQLGIHGLSNSRETMADLKRGKMKILTYERLKDFSHNFSQPLAPLLEQEITFPEDAHFIFSLDADGLDGIEMPAVSAVNPKGLSFSALNEILNFFVQNVPKDKRVLGLYEYNPLFDDLAAAAGKRLAYLIWEFLGQK